MVEDRISKLPIMIEDRVSKLPDEVLHHILSSLDIKQAVRTSVLSKRWRYLPHSLPNLTFDFYRLLNQSPMKKSWTNRNPQFMSLFTRFVLHFLSRMDPTSTLEKFQLKSNDMPTNSKFVQKCIDYVTDHNVQTLDLDVFCHPAPLKFPDGLFASKTLGALKLKQYTRSTVVPKPFVLPNLKSLFLDSFEFNDDIHSFQKEPFSGLVDLEELTIRNCEVHDMIIRCSSKLRVLEISFQSELFSRQVTIEEISTVGPVSFRYIGHYSLVCNKVDLACLEEVYYDNFDMFEAPYTDDIKKKMPLNLVTILQQLGHAKFVTLTFHTLQLLALDHRLLKQSPSPFRDIKGITLKRERRYANDPIMETVPQTLMNYLIDGCDNSPVVKFLFI